jgi:hypothetical protein
MPKRKSYSELELIPALIAEAVVNRPYTGDELSVALRSQRTVEAVEAARQALTAEQRAEFVRQCDERCRAAYAHRADWFMKCVRARNNTGRDQLYLWCAHWLSAFVG